MRVLLIAVVWGLCTLGAHAGEVGTSLSSDASDAAARDDGELAGVGPMGRPIGTYRRDQRVRQLRIVQAPVVHSLSATTANLEWMTSLPAVCDLAWGETPECENTDKVEVDHFGTYSLTGLDPGKTYYFRLTRLRIPSELSERFQLEPVRLDGSVLSFTTRANDAPPRTYYVASDGDDDHSGVDRDHAWRTIGHAAAQVNVGDTVRIAGGTYMERVRIRATGVADAPITFAALPGEKVVLSGAGKRLNHAFLAANKSHLRFDGFYLSEFNPSPSQGWNRNLAGEFNLYRCDNIQITRCFSDGRGGTTARFITAWQVNDLLIQNCVITSKMSGSMMLWFCPGLRLENSVIARPLIASFVLRNEADQPAMMAGNIFTDMLKKKADLNINLFVVDRSIDGLRQINNGYFLRSFPPAERALIREWTYRDLSAQVIDPLFEDPRFAGDSSSGDVFGPDRMMHPGPLDFDDFFTTNPKMIERGIGLQPEAFADFKFE